MKKRKNHIKEDGLTGFEFLPVKSENSYPPREPIKFIDPKTGKDASLPSTNTFNTDYARYHLSNN